jgi:hypothetical protein
MSSSEIEILDQLSGGDMPLRILIPLFPSTQHGRIGIGALFDAGEIRVLDAAGQELAKWQRQGLLRLSDAEWTQKAVRLSAGVTDHGLKRLHG